MINLFRGTCLLMLVVLVGTLPATAQKKGEATNHRSVQGVVTDAAESPADGAVVQMKDTKTLQIRSFITKDNGAFHFNGLNPDVDYELKAEFKGVNSSPKTLSSFDGRKIAVINLKVSR